MTEITFTYNQYVDDVLSGKELVCIYVRQAVERHVSDLDNLKGYYFDDQEAQRHISFFHILPHIEGEWANRNELIVLEPWQQFLLAMVYGWKKDSGARRFTTAYLEVSRKNAKSTIAAGVCLDGILIDGEAGAQVYCAATKEDQAKITWSIASAMINKSRHLAKYLKAFAKSITFFLDEKTFFKPLGRDSNTQDGLNPHIAVIDEFHAWKDDSLYNVIRSGMGARKNPLTWIITTAGFNKQGPCFKMRKTVIEILNKTKQNERFFGIIFTLDEGDDFEDPTVWIKANPNLNISVYPDFLEAEITTAKNEGYSKIVNVKTKHFNLWEGSSSQWIPSDDLKKCNYGTPPDSLLDKDCYGGLDLSSVDDFVSLTLYFPGDPAAHKTFYWIPEETLQRKYADFRDWHQLGFVKATPGNVIDYKAIRKDLTGVYLDGDTMKYDENCLINHYNILSIAYDRYNSDQIILDLKDDKGEDFFFPFGQGYISMNAPTKQIEKLIRGGQIDLMNDPVMIWMFGNVELSMDPAGNIKPDKKKSQDKIDGVVSLIMAVGEAMHEEREKQFSTIYDEEAEI